VKLLLYCTEKDMSKMLHRDMTERWKSRLAPSDEREVAARFDRFDFANGNLSRKIDPLPTLTHTTSFMTLQVFRGKNYIDANGL
jgi:hypothetical protein